jgi:uncharacterized membrane protein
VIDRLADWIGVRSEDWLNYVGIGLLLFGLAFLFKYSVEQGWLVPTVRVGFGAALGSVLSWAGLRVYDTRRRLRRVLLGGSSATFYATVFAAYQLYGLVAYPVAFGSMLLVTVATIGLAVRQEASSLAVIGTVGGLGTPFLLYGPAEGVSGLAAYTCIVLAGACAIVFVKGWRSLLYTSVAGGWLVFLVAALRAGRIGPRPSDAWALQVGIGVAWLLLAGTPVARALYRRARPAEGTGAALRGWIDRLLGDAGPVYGLVPASPLLALGASRLLWSPPNTVWALVAGAGALIYAGAALGLQRASLDRYAPMHGLVAAVLAAYGLSEALDGSALLVAWAVEGVGLLAVARRLNAGTLRWAGHALFVILMVGLGGRLADAPSEGRPLMQPAVLSELAVLGSLVGAARLVRRRWLRGTYWGVALGGWLAWWFQGLGPVGHGQAYVSVIWGVTAAGLLLGGAWTDRRPLQIGGLATLGLFVGKLFFVDLAALPALGRIALFLGFGGVFLAISYLLPGLTMGPSRQPGAEEDEEDLPSSPKT